MSNPESTGPAHPARAAGLALIAVAAVALVVGVVSLFTGGDDGEAGAQPTDAPSSSQAAGTPSESPGPTSDAGQSPTPGPEQTTPPPATTAPGATTTPAAGTTAVPPPPPVQGQGKPPVRVYNNGTIGGLAATAAEDVRRAGWEVADVANYSQGLIPTTTVYYRPGTDEEASARQLGEALGVEVKPRFDGIEQAHAGIIVIVTDSYQSRHGKV